MRTKLVILYVIAVFGGLGVGIVSDFEGQTMIGASLKKLKERTFFKLSRWGKFCLEYASIFIFIFGPLYLYILFFPNDYPLRTAFSSTEIILCLLISVVTGRIVKAFL